MNRPFPPALNSLEASMHFKMKKEPLDRSDDEEALCNQGSDRKLPRSGCMDAIERPNRLINMSNKNSINI